jgi:hypothetical protein
MSLKFPISLVGKRSSSGFPSGILSILYTSNDGVLAAIDGDIPDGYNNDEVIYHPARLSIGSSCGSIGSYAFGYNSNLTIIDTLDPPPSTLTSIGNYAFVDTPITGSVFLPSTLDLGVGVFYGTNITDVTIELETLGNTADGYGMFENCGHIESVTLLDSCKNLYGPIFYDTRPDQSGYPAQFTLDLGSVVNIGAIGSDYGPFEYSGAIGNLNLPNTVEVIGDYAFSSSNGLTGALTIPDSVTTIGIYAFDDCTGFNGNLTISNSVTSIGDYAFDGCISMGWKVLIPESVTSIGTEAFRSCTGVMAWFINTPASSWTSTGALTNTYGTLHLGPQAQGTGYTNNWQGGLNDAVPWDNYPEPIFN